MFMCYTKNLFSFSFTTAQSRSWFSKIVRWKLRMASYSIFQLFHGHKYNQSKYLHCLLLKTKNSHFEKCNGTILYLYTEKKTKVPLIEIAKSWTLLQPKNLPLHIGEGEGWGRDILIAWQVCSPTQYFLYHALFTIVCT